MKSAVFSASGIPAVGDVPWGTHFCQFYRTRDDLVATLIPYFTAGLRNNEYCMWITSDPLPADDAKAEMLRLMPDFGEYLEKGQIEIHDHRQWYTPGESFSADRVLQQWTEKEQRAIDRGFGGVRLTGNTFWLERAIWNDFMSYEETVNRNFEKFRMIALCTYSLDTCTAEDILAVVRTHQFALSRRDGEWELIENSALKAAKEELRKLNDELEQRVLDRTSKLEDALKSRDQFLAMLAHELRNPLAPLRNGLHIVQMPSATPAHRDSAVKTMERQVQHMGRMVDDLLDVSRITRGKIQIRKQRTDLAPLVRSTVEDHRRLVEEAGQTLRVTLPDHPVWVSADPTRVAQVLSNLLNNAIKFSERQGVISVDLTLDGSGKSADLKVRDTGIGIDASMLARLFEPFAQADNTLARSRGGLGLGLALVKGITQLHGGTVAAQSDGPGTGSTFAVQLPVAPAPDTTTPGDADADLAQGAGRRVLIIEDNADTAESLRLLLQLMGHNAAVAHTGETGIEAARRLKPDVVLCDIGLPGMDGYAVASHLRDDEAMSKAFLVAVTGYGQDDDQRRARDAGFDLHLTKPADPNAIERLLNTLGRP